MLGWVDAVTQAFDVRKGPRDPEARALSGGNLQKFVVGREILRRPASSSSRSRPGAWTRARQA
jgi:general nucleoside transport system ATP-binding protein